MAIKRKAFVIFAHQNGGEKIEELNTLLDAGWDVKRVEQSPSASGNMPSWFVVAEKLPSAAG